MADKKANHLHAGTIRPKHRIYIKGAMVTTWSRLPDVWWREGQGCQMYDNRRDSGCQAYDNRTAGCQMYGGKNTWLPDVWWRERLRLLDIWWQEWTQAATCIMARTAPGCHIYTRWDPSYQMYDDKWDPGYHIYITKWDLGFQMYDE